MVRRVRRPKDKDHIFTEYWGNEKKLNFDRFGDIFTLAACLGYYHKESIPFEKTSEPIDWRFFREKAQDILKMLALVDTEDPAILLEENNEEMSTIIEGYANAGLKILDEKALKQEQAGKARVDSLLNLVYSPYEPGESRNPEDIIKELMSE